MTEYINVDGVKKRLFNVAVKLSGDRIIFNRPKQYIARNGDTYIARNGDTYIANEEEPQGYTRAIRVRKRTFSVPVRTK